ncbi:hypothetical protein SprV_0100346700 [Sparganum proliferum]
MSPKNDKLVHNLSSKELTKYQMQVLRHEASFNTADAKPVNMIVAVESVLCQTEATEETKSLIRHQVSSLLMAHRPREVLSKVERDALRELKADKDLVIVPADKGRSTVVLDRKDYLQKAKGAITPTDRRMARPQDTALARFYGLPKVHKDGAPLRPIVSLKGTPTYGPAKWLFRRLKFLTAESDTTVSSSAQFLEKLKGDLAIETIELLLQSKYDETDNRIGRAQILHLLKLCLRTYFTFDGTIYEQVKGTPMGSPISGFIAEAVLQRLESLVFQHHKPKFWARYVDDTFVVIERDQMLTFQEHLNAVFPDIQFTMEEEENNQLAFLDVLVCRKDCGGLKTKVFRKATNTMQVLNFNSNHPISHKRSCVRTLYRRVETHCSEPEDKIAELQYLRRVFKANGYPSNFVNRCIRKRDERPNRTDTKSWRALPYVKNVSEAVGRLLAPLGVGIAHRPEATIRRLVMKPKDPLPRQETSGVVYRIWCSCGESNYVGETGRQLRTRMAEHAAAVRRNDASSQVAAHSTRPGHTFKFDEAEILARGDNRVSRELLESWFTGPQSINKCNELPLPYSVLKFRLGGLLGLTPPDLSMKIPPLRSLDDMFGSKFSVPKDEKTCDRITSNLLYYQSNYFLITIIFMGITFILSPLSILLSLSTVGACILLYANIDNWWPFASRPSELWVFVIVSIGVFLYLLPFMTPALLCLGSISLEIVWCGFLIRMLLASIDHPWGFCSDKLKCEMDLPSCLPSKEDEVLFLIHPTLYCLRSSGVELDFGVLLSF